MDLNTEIPESVLGAVAEEYAAMCVDDPVFVSRVTNWDAAGAKRLVEARTRLYDEFKTAGIDSVEDVVGVELARAYLAYAEKDMEVAVARFERVMAACLRAIRRIRLEQGSKTNEGNLELDSGASGHQEGP